MERKEKRYFSSKQDIYSQYSKLFKEDYKVTFSNLPIVDSNVKMLQIHARVRNRPQMMNKMKLIRMFKYIKNIIFTSYLPNAPPEKTPIYIGWTYHLIVQQKPSRKDREGDEQP